MLTGCENMKKREELREKKKKKRRIKVKCKFMD